jgi:hypothetical protein
MYKKEQVINQVEGFKLTWMHCKSAIATASHRFRFHLVAVSARSQLGGRW